MKLFWDRRGIRTLVGRTLSRLSSGKREAHSIIALFTSHLEIIIDFTRRRYGSQSFADTFTASYYRSAPLLLNGFADCSASTSEPLTSVNGNTASSVSQLLVSFYDFAHFADKGNRLAADKRLKLTGTEFTLLFFRAKQEFLIV